VSIIRNYKEIIQKTRKPYLFLAILFIIIFSLSLTFLLRNQIRFIFKPSYPITITATGEPGFGSHTHASEVWILEILVNGSTKNLSDISLGDGWEYYIGEYREGIIRSYDNQPAELNLLLSPGLIWIHFLRHSWSGIVTVEVNNNIQVFDLYLSDYNSWNGLYIINTDYPTKYEQITRLFTVFLIINIFMITLISVVYRYGAQKPFSVILVVAITINFIQIKKIDDPGNYYLENRTEMSFMKALYITHESDFISNMIGISNYWAKRYGIYVAISNIGNNINLIIPTDLRDIIVIDASKQNIPEQLLPGHLRYSIFFNAFNTAISNVNSFEDLSYDQNTFIDILFYRDNIESLIISNEQIDFSVPYQIIANPYNDYVKELILLNEDNVLILLDTSLLSYEDHNRIEELRE